MKRIFVLTHILLIITATALFAQVPPIDIPEPDSGTVSIVAKGLTSVTISKMPGESDYGTFYPILLSPDGKCVAVGNSDGYASQLFSAVSGNKISDLNLLSHIAFAPESSVFCLFRGCWNLTYDKYESSEFTQIDKASGKTKKIKVKQPSLMTFDIDTGYITNCQPLQGKGYLHITSCMSCNGQLMALNTDGDKRKEIHVWDTKTLNEVSIYRDFEGFTDCCLNPNGSVLAVCSPDHQVKIWDIKSSKLATSLDAHDRGDVIKVIFSPDGKYLASADKQGKIIIWNTSTWKSARTITIDTTKDSFINSIAFSPDGKLLAVAQDNQRDGTYYYRNRIQLWAAASGEKVYEIKLPETAYDAVKAVTFSSDGKTMAALSYGYDYDATKGSQQWRYKLYFWRISSEVVAAPDAAMLRIKVQDAISQNKLEEAEKLAKEVVSLDSGSAESQSLYGEVLCKEMKFAEATSAINEAMRIDPANAEKYKAQIKKVQEDQQAQEKARIDRENAEKQRLISEERAKQKNPTVGAQSTTPKSASVYTLENLKTDMSIRALQCAYVIYALHFGPKGNSLVSTSSDYSIRVWNLSTGNAKYVLGDHIGSVSISPDRKIIAGGEADGRIRLWNAETGKELRSFKAHWTWVASTSFSPDGKMLASVCGNKIIKIWDVSTGKLLRELKSDSDNGYVCFSRDGKMLLSGCNNGIDSWDMKTGKSKHMIKEANCSVALSPDGRTRASMTYCNSPVVKLWDVSTGKQTRTIKTDSTWVGSIEFSPDNKILATGCFIRNNDDFHNAVKLWDVSTGKLIATLDKLLDANGLSFSPDGRTLAICDNRQIILWDISAIKR